MESGLARKPVTAGPFNAPRWSVAKDSIRLVSGTTYRADIEMSDPDGDPIDYRWELKPESGALQVGGDAEQAIENLEIEFSGAEKPQVTFRAPAAGAYRLYVYGYDRAGHAAHANVLFWLNAHGKDSVTPG